MLIIFWDYDGTLVQTEVEYMHSIQFFLKKNNYELKELNEDYFFKNISGKHPEEFIDKLEADSIIKPNLKIDPNEIKKNYREYFNNLEKGEIEITKNIDLVIEKLSNQKNIIMCITSSSFITDFKIKHNNVDNKILNKNFDVEKNVYLCGAIENCRFKPYPDIFLYAFSDIIKKYKLNPTKNDNLLIIEDSPTGCVAGRNFKNLTQNKINIKIIGYIGGSISDNTPTLLENGADIIAKDANDLYNKIIKYI